MKKNKALVVLRITFGLVCWFLISKLYGIIIDPKLEGILPVTLRMIMAAMVIPYTLGLGVFLLVAGGISGAGFPYESEELKPGLRTIIKYFVIQTGLSFPVMVLASVVQTLAGIEPHSLTAADLFGHVWFYVVLLLIFNPVFEELLFRKLILNRLSCLGARGAVICSAVLFAMPHVYSQGLPQMFFTFAAGLVWAYITIKTGKLWPAIVLHALSNIYCAYIPMLITMIHPALSILFVMMTISLMLPLTIVFVTRQVNAEKNKALGASGNDRKCNLRA